MATFLKICQDVARECGVAGGADASPRPTTVVGQSGESNRIVNWVADAYVEIQSARSWRWLRKDFTFDTVSGTDTYAFGAVTDVDTAAAITRFREWRVKDRRNPPRLYLQSAGVNAQVFINYMRWDIFESIYKIGAVQSQTSQPTSITINPDDELVLALTPNDVYTVTGSYIRSPQILAADGDVPEMPDAFHSLIKYQAMEYYGIFESAPEIISRAQRGISRVMNQLKRNQEPVIRRGGPLA
jgi:hypothetical protein